MVLLLGPHPDRRFYLLFHSRKMNRFYILAFYFVINDGQASPGSDLNVEIQLDIAGKSKSHEECPHKTSEHKTEGHGHGLHDLPGMFFGKMFTSKIISEDNAYCMGHVVWHMLYELLIK